MIHVVVTMLAARRGVHLAQCNRLPAVVLAAELWWGGCAAGGVVGDRGGDLPKACEHGVLRGRATEAAGMN